MLLLDFFFLFIYRAFLKQWGGEGEIRRWIVCISMVLKCDRKEEKESKIVIPAASRTSRSI